jgi:excinuclease ABC subunit A
LDEPTTGLHFDDVRKLLEVLHQLTDLGNTVIIIEHNLDVIRNADWIIDLGPEGGEDGGRLVAEGRPAKVAATEDSFTGQFLKRYYSSANGHLEAAEQEEVLPNLALVSGGSFPCANGSATNGSSRKAASPAKKRDRRNTTAPAEKKSRKKPGR